MPRLTIFVLSLLLFGAVVAAVQAQSPPPTRDTQATSGDTKSPTPTKESQPAANETPSPTPTRETTPPANETWSPTPTKETPQPSKDSPTPSRESPPPTTNREDPPKDNGTGTGEEPRRLAGRFEVDERAVEGRYVQFRLDLPGCALLDFRVYGVPILTRLQLPASRCRLAGEHPPGVIEIRGQGAGLRAHDTPNALVQFMSQNGSVELFFHPDVMFPPEGDPVAFSVANLTGRVFSRNHTDLNRTEGMVWGPQGALIVHPAAGKSAERREIFDAIQRGRIGGEADVLVEDGRVVNEVLSYDDVSLRVRRHSQDRFDFTVDGRLPEGRVFVTHFDPGAWDPGRVRVDYGDVEVNGDVHPVLIRQASSLDQVLDVDSTEGPVFFAFQDEDGWHVAVAVPEFSVHVFQVIGLPLEVVPLLLYGIVFGGLFLVTGGIGIVMERRARAR